MLALPALLVTPAAAGTTAGSPAVEPTGEAPSPSVDATDSPSPTQSPDGTQSPGASTEPTADESSPTPTPEAGDGTADPPVGRAPRAVPPPATGRAIITVRTGGDRENMNTTVTGVGAKGVAGVTLRLSSSATNPNAWSSYTWATCISDADGDCTFDSANGGVRVQATTSSTGMASTALPYVHQISAPTGWRLVQPTLGLSTGATVTSPYVFRLDSVVAAGNTYRSTTNLTFMRSVFETVSGDEARRSSHGKWMVARDNPPAVQSCGLNIAMVADLSISVGAKGLPNLTKAMDGLVDGLRGTPSKVALFNFSSHSPARQYNSVNQNYPALMDVQTTAQGTAVKNLYSNWVVDSATNWDHAFWTVAAEQPSRQYDVVVFITDGLPTWHSTAQDNALPIGGYGNLRSLEAAVYSANLLKGRGARIIPFFVNSTGTTGSEIQPAAYASMRNNLRAISGPTEGSDFFWADSYATATQQLTALARGNCEGSVKVTKRVVNAGFDTTGATAAQLEANSSVASGWTFSSSSLNSTNVTIPGAVGNVLTQTTGASGSVTVPVRFPHPSVAGDISITETQKPTYSLVQVGGRNAVCRDLETGSQPTGYANYGALGFRLTAKNSNAIECVVYNQPPAPTGSLGIGKLYDSSVSPANAIANFNGNYYCTLGGASVAAGTWTRTGTGAAVLTRTSGAQPNAVPVGASCTVTEDTSSLGSTGLTSGYTWSSNPIYSPPVTIASGTTRTLTVTNKAIPPSKVTVVKNTVDKLGVSSAAVPDWRFDFSASSTVPGNTISPASGSGTTSGAPGAAGRTWTLSHTADAGRADVTVTENPSAAQIADGWKLDLDSISCVDSIGDDVDFDVDPGTGAVSGIDVGPGDDVTCTFTNRQDKALGAVTWSKVAKGTSTVLGGSEWRLTGSSPASALDVEDCVADTVDECGDGPDTDPEAGRFRVVGLEWDDYTLTETKAPPGYKLLPADAIDPFTIDAAHLDIAIGGIENEQQAVPGIPLTGGLGQDGFFLAGGGLFAALLTLFLIRRRKGYGPAAAAPLRVMGGK
jgi:hypothetical protein